MDVLPLRCVCVALWRRFGCVLPLDPKEADIDEKTSNLTHFCQIHLHCSLAKCLVVRP